MVSTVCDEWVYLWLDHLVGGSGLVEGKFVCLMCARKLTPQSFEENAMPNNGWNISMRLSCVNEGQIVRQIVIICIQLRDVDSRC